jgi:hypothetical protein
MPKAVRNSVLENWGAPARALEEVKDMTANLTDISCAQTAAGQKAAGRTLLKLLYATCDFPDFLYCSIFDS